MEGMHGGDGLGIYYNVGLEVIVDSGMKAGGMVRKGE